jgi:hypothetical protein
MGFNYVITFYDAEGKDIDSEVLERRYTHYPDDVRTFWWDICYTEKPKKEFVDMFLEKIKTQDINSKSFQLLTSAFGLIVGMDGWCEAIVISVSCN